MFKSALILISISTIFAQSIDLELIGSAGGGANSEGFELKWGVGEVIIGPFDSTANSTTHGFFQIEIQEMLNLKGDKNLGEQISIKRTSRSLSIIFGNTLREFTVRLYNIKGQNLKNYSTEKTQQVLNIPISIFSSGVVFMNIYTTDKQIVKSYKLSRGVGK